MATVRHWQYGDWDVVILAGEWLPGVASVDISLPAGLDVQKPKGGHGATIRDEGHPPIALKIRLQFDTADELAEFVRLLPLLRPRAKGGARDPMEIVHQGANAVGVTAVVIGDIDIPAPTAVGGLVVEISAVEWFPAPKPAKQGSAKTKQHASASRDEAEWSKYRGDEARKDTPGKHVAPAVDIF